MNNSAAVIDALRRAPELHDFFHAYRIEELLLRSDLPDEAAENG
jgi:hypothetical protein